VEGGGVRLVPGADADLVHDTIEAKPKLRASACASELEEHQAVLRFPSTSCRGWK
jgi:hypothetical protein